MKIIPGGSDVTIFAVGIMVEKALKAYTRLSQEGIDACIVNMHTLKPIDKELIVKAAKETGGIVTAEEHNIIGGLGSAVAEIVSENQPVPLKRIGIQDRFGQSGTAGELLREYGLTAEDIVRAAKEVIVRKKRNQGMPKRYLR